MTPFSIALACSELTPFAKTGGLADVASGLSRELALNGHDVRVFVPYYPRIAKRLADEGRPPTVVPNAHDIELGFPDQNGRRAAFSLFETSLDPQLPPAQQPRVLLVDCPELFGGEDIYGGDADEWLRFATLSRAVLESCQRMGWAPDVVHCNDWHTAAIPLLLRTHYAWDKLFANTKTLLTIHNIGYQGVCGPDALAGFGWGQLSSVLDPNDLELGLLNLLKTGVLHASAVNTVSKTYAREIRETELGMGLQAALRQRADDLFGIVNGVDYGEWDPEHDPRIPFQYSAADLSGKARCKTDLLETFGLAPADEGPGEAALIGTVSRLTSQKGFELLTELLPELLERFNVRFVALGSGERDLERFFQGLHQRFPRKAAFYSGYNEDLAHRIEASSDLFLMPSRYEPCGLNQMYSLKYGTIPVVRATGGLADTVEPFDRRTGEGTGFLFEPFETRALTSTLLEALDVWSDPALRARCIQNGMALDWSWKRQVREYEALYQRLSE